MGILSDKSIKYMYWAVHYLPPGGTPELRITGPQSVEESECYTQLCVSTSIPASVPISFMYSVTDGSATSEVGEPWF